MASNELSEIPDEFISQNPAHEEIKKSTKRGGHYSKINREKIMTKISLLFIDFDYSARKIA